MEINIGPRVKSLVEKKGFTVVEFAQKVGVSEQHMHRIFKKDKIHTNMLSKIGKALGYNIIELLREGPLTADEPEGIYQATVKGSIYFIPTTMLAEYMQEPQKFLSNNQLASFSIPGFEEGKFSAFKAEGDSMYPLIAGGDIVICSRIKNKNDIIEKEPYLLYADEGFLLKRISKSKSKDKMILHSDNDFYPDREISLKKIISIWCIKGIISKNTSPRRK